MPSETLKKIADFRHNQLRELLEQCTEPQQTLFNRMYGSIDSISEDRIDWAIQQCEGTLKKNAKVA